MDRKITLGSKVRCLITGFEGIATARCEYINGCVQYGVRPKLDEDDKEKKYPDICYLDVESLEVISKDIDIAPSLTGGERNDAPLK